MRITGFLRENRWLIVGVGAIAATGVLSAGYVRSAVASAHRAFTPPATTTVWVARSALPAYVPISRSDLRAQKELTATVPAGAYTSPQSLSGAWSTEAISPGMPIVPSAVFFPKSASVLAAQIGPGDLAIDIPLSSAAAVDGLISPGDAITIFVTVGPKNPTIETFMSRVKVLAVNGSLAPVPQPAVGQNPDLIVALPPAQIERLLLAEQTAGTHLSVALESPHSTAPTTPTPYPTSRLETPRP